MAELTTRERLQPSLLDRLTDDAPQERVESRDKRVMSMRQLRAAVLRDLEWLLNAGCRPMGDDVYDYPLVAKSVINYGMADMAGLSAAGVTQSSVEKMVQLSILTFEPRITGSTLRVQAVALDGMESGVTFQISGELCPLPMPEPLYVKTTVDLDTGRCEVKEGQQ